jgi:hypothetical protein
VTSHLTEDFRKAFDRLPESVKRRARKSYRIWKNDPHHPGLDFKRVHTRRPIYSIRVGMDWRALGIVDGNRIVWFWIGSHNAYDRLIAQL